MLSRRELFGTALAGVSLSSPPAFASRRLTQANLIDIAQQHGLWLEGRPGGAFADLRGADLTGLCLSGIDLSLANLTGAKLAGVYGIGFVCLRGRLMHADLTEVQLIGPALDGAILDHADLRGAWLYEGDELPGVSKIGAEIGQRASLLGASFNSANLSGARINAYLAGTSFEGANLARANLSLCRGSADFTHANLTGATLDNCEFKVVDFTGAELQGCTFNGTTARRGHALPSGIQIG